MRMRLLIVLLLGSAPLAGQTVYISADMEGIAGLSATDDPAGRALMTGEVNAAIAGAFEGGARAVVVNDAHGSHANLIQSDLDARATLIRGDLKPYGMMQGLESDMLGVVFIGYHGRAGSAGSFAAHTGSGAVADLVVNGRQVGEGGMNTLYAAWFGVPVIFVSGDSVAVVQAQELSPYARGAAVKAGIWNRAVRSMSPETARRAIREGTAAAVEAALRSRPQPTRPAVPVVVQLRYTDPLRADIAVGIPGVDRADHTAVRFQTQAYPEAYRMIRVLYKHVRP